MLIRHDYNSIGISLDSCTNRLVLNNRAKSGLPLTGHVLLKGIDRQQRNLSAGIIEIRVVYQVDVHHFLYFNAAHHHVLDHIGKEFRNVFALGQHRQQKLHAFQLVRLLRIEKQ